MSTFLSDSVDHLPGSPRHTQPRASQPEQQRKRCMTTLYVIILRFGFKTRIVYDQGSEFEKKLFHQLEECCGMLQSGTTPYHPQGNGKTERLNQTHLDMLRILP